METNYKKLMYWKQLDGKNALDVRTFAAISSIYHGFKRVCEVFFAKYSQNSDAYICPSRLTTNKNESLFNEVRCNNHDNLVQYGNTLASKSVHAAAKNKF